MGKNRKPSGNSMKAVAVGDTCIDYYEDPVRWYPTGNCVDFAVNLSDLGGEVSIISRVGNDTYGVSIQELLREHHVDCRHVQVLAGSTPITRMRLGGATGKDRIHGSFEEGVMKGFNLSEEEISFILKHKIVHTHYYGRADRYLQRFKEEGLTVVYDFSTNWELERHRDVERFVDYGFFSWKQDDPDIRRYLAEAVLLNDMRIAIATFGEGGSIACESKVPRTENGTAAGDDTRILTGPEYEGTVCFYRQSAVWVPNEKLVNTVGAGDSFIAGFVRGLQKRKDIPACLACGAETAAKIVQVFEPFLSCEEKL